MDDIDADVAEFVNSQPKQPKQRQLFPEDEIDADIREYMGQPPADATAPLGGIPKPPRKPNKFDVDLDQLNLNLEKAAEANPTEAARKSALSKALGLPIELLPPDAEKQAFYRANDPVGLLKEYPEIANYLNQADNASIGGKNIENLKAIRNTMRRATVDPVITAAKGTMAVPEFLVGIADIFSKGKAGKAVEDAGVNFEDFKGKLNSLYSDDQKKANSALQRSEGFLDTAGTMLENPSTIAHAVTESVPAMLTGGAVGQVVRKYFPKVSALVAGAIGEGTVMAGGSAERIRQQTESGELTGEQAALAAGIGVVGGSVGVLGAKIMQRLGFGDIDTALASGKLNDALAGSGMLKSLAARVIAGGVSEGGLEEMPQSAVEQIAENVALGKAWDEGVDKAMAQGLLTGTTMGSGVQLLTAGAQPEQKPVDKELDEAGAAALKGLAQAVQASEHRNSLAAMFKTAKDDPMRKGAPEAFQNFVKTMAEEDGSISEVYVDGKLLDSTLQQSGIDRAEIEKRIPTLKRDLQNALQTNGDVRIGIDDFATHIVGTGIEDQLLDNLRTEPEGMTYKESEQFYQSQKEEFTKQAEEIVKAHQPVATREEFMAQNPDLSYEEYLKGHTNTVEAFAQDAQEVHNKILEGMTQARRFNRFVNEVYAVPFREFYSVNAAREGILPSELYARLPLNFSKMQIEQGFSQRTPQPGSMTVMGVHFSKERRAALEGKYVGTGMPAAERDRLYMSTDPRINMRVDFYTDTGNGITPESGLGGVRHDILLSNIYDGSTNPLKFKVPNRPDKTGMNDFESQVLDAGFDGYFVKQGNQGRVVVLGQAAESIPTGEANEPGRGGILPQQARTNIGTREADGSLQGLPRKVGNFTASHSEAIEQVTREYMAKAGLTYNPPNVYAKVDEARAKRIAQAFTEMKHDPQDPEVKAAYDAMIRETAEQYKAAIAAGLKVEFIDFAKTGDPYEGSPRKMTEDVINNNHMWVFSTREGFGSSEFDPADNPLLAETEFTISGQKALANDIFRVVHDYFGHVKEGVGFRAAGEENAWRAHMAMFSPLAGRALTTETRGQNSWVNFGPFAEHNKTASGADTHYADQKIGLLPEWVATEGVNDGGQLNQSAFYSALEREISGLQKIADKNGMIQPHQAMKWIESRQKDGKFKKEEVEAVGLIDWLEVQQDKIAVADIENFVRENGVRVEETVLDDQAQPSDDEVFDRAYDAFLSDNYFGGDEQEEQEAWESQSNYYLTNAREELGRNVPGVPEYKSFVLPGGSNYKELLLTLPGKRLFKAPHFEGVDENIIAHTRIDERIANGQRVLFVEEIQSDWAQQGRDKGFGHLTKDEEEERLDLRIERDRLVAERESTPGGRINAPAELNDKISSIQERLAALNEKAVGVIPGPFVQDTKTWTALVVKRLMRYAAENGFDRIAWTTGAQQNARYNLADRITSIDATLQDEGYYVYAEDTQGRSMIADFYSANELPDAVGRSIADKIVKNATVKGEKTVLTGLDLEVGGDGMKSFYDRIVPSVFNDVSKKLGGGKVDTINFGETFEQYLKRVKLFINPQDDRAYTSPDFDPRTKILGTVAGLRRQFEESPDVKKGPGIQQSLAITPEMKDKIMQGLPLFQGPRAGFNPQTLTISLLQGSDLSSVIHEGGHFYLEALANLAAQPNATQQVKDDFAKTMDWFGTTEEQWRAMNLEQQRPHHEQWAQSFERYTLEGKAPTLEMQPVFARFRSWMLNIYKSMKEFLRQNPLAGKLNDDIRGVFDRLIASEEAITAAEKARKYAPLFATAEEAGVTPKAFSDYIELGNDATQVALDQLNSRSVRDMKWLSGARSRMLKKLQAEAKVKRAEIKREVTQEVNEEPVNRARLFLTKGQFVNENGEVVEAQAAAKLNLAEIKALVPDFTPSQLRGMTAEDGIALDLAGQMFGYGSGEALLDDLLNGEKAADKIEGLTDQRMLQENGDLVDDQSIENAADEAIHNEARARFLATGLKMLMTTKGVATAKELSKAAKQAAESAIAAKMIREITPGQYARAEAKANAEAIKQAPKDRVKAAEAQRAALLNNKLAKVAGEARREVDIILRYVKKFDNKNLFKTVDMDYLEQIRDLLAPFNLKNLPLKQIDKNKSLADWIDEQEANGFEPAIDPAAMEELKRKSYKDMTLEELRGLRDTIKQIEHIGRYKKKLLTALDKREFQERITEANESIRDNANRTVEERGTPTDIVGRTGQWFRQMAASHRKFNSIIREMDGGKDGGVMWSLLSRGMNDAGNNETEARQQAAMTVAKLFKMIKIDQGFGNLSAKKRLVPGTKLSMTHEQRIMFGMNWGNNGNRQRLLDGGITGQRALSTQEAQAVLDTLTKNEWDFIQATWDFIAGYRDQVAALERKMTGVEPKWVEPSPVNTKHGVYRGGYFPAKYDAELSTRSEALEASVDLRMGMQGVFQSAATRNGYTKERSAKVIGRPLLLSFNVIPQHVNEVTHRLAWQPWLTDANRVLKALDLPIREHYGTEILRELRDTVNDIAIGDAPAKNATEAAINRLRIGSTIVGMGWRVATALLQPSGLAQSTVRIGGKWVTKGLFQFMTSPNDSAKFVDAKSSLMKNRGITMQREINEVLNTIRTGETVSAVTASYFSLIGKMQRTVDIPTWIGAYEKGLADNRFEAAVNDEQRDEIESKAIALADQAVMDSQSGGMLKDLAKVQRGSPLHKILTNFYSYFSATYNLNVEAVRKTSFKSPTEVLILANDLILLNIVPVLFAVALKEAIKGECDQELECMAGKLAQEQVSFLMGQMILLREIGAAVGVATGGEMYGYQGPAGLRFFGDLYGAGVQIRQGEPDMAMFKSINKAAGAVLHYPAGQINATVEGIVAIEEGRVEGLSVFPALIFGPPKD